MKRIYTEPTIGITMFDIENIATSSGTETTSITAKEKLTSNMKAAHPNLSIMEITY